MSCICMCARMCVLCIYVCVVYMCVSCICVCRVYVCVSCICVCGVCVYDVGCIHACTYMFCVMCMYVCIGERGKFKEGAINMKGRREGEGM